MLQNNTQFEVQTLNQNFSFSFCSHNKQNIIPFSLSRALVSFWEFVLCAFFYIMACIHPCDACTFVVVPICRSLSNTVP
jgi:hypothetical protein